MEEQSVDFMFTLILVTVFIVNNSLVNIKKVSNVINFSWCHQSLLFFKPIPLSLNPTNSWSALFFFSHKWSSFTRKHVTLRKRPGFHVDWSRCVLFVLCKAQLAVNGSFYRVIMLSCKGQSFLPTRTQSACSTCSSTILSPASRVCLSNCPHLSVCVWVILTHSSPSISVTSCLWLCAVVY